VHSDLEFADPFKTANVPLLIDLYVPAWVDVAASGTCTMRSKTSRLTKK